MKLVPMRFKGVEWLHNPENISFECDKQVNELKSPNGCAYIQNMGRKNMKIIGSGKLFGNDCLEQFNRLFELFRQGGSGVLAIDGIDPIFAVFESLKIEGEHKPDVLCYSFVFREAMEQKGAETVSVHTVKKDETLWDISYKYDIPTDRLLKLNADIKRPDELESGMKVILC